MDSVLVLLDPYAAAMAGEGMRPQTIQRYRQVVTLLVAWADPGATVADLTPALIAEYQAELGRVERAARTIRLTLSAIRSFCRWCIRQGYRTSDPTATLTWPRPPKTPPKALTGEELQALHAALADPPTRRGRSVGMWARNTLAIHVLLYAGLRLGELCRLSWDHVDLVWGVLRVVDGKGGKDREVPLAEVLWALLDHVPRAERQGPVIKAGWRARHRERPEAAFLNEKAMAKLFSVWLPGIGVHDIHAHRLRHTCATQLRQSGADLKDIQEVLGHESLATTDGYLRSDPEQLRAAVNRLPPLAEMGHRRGGRPRPPLTIHRGAGERRRAE